LVLLRPEGDIDQLVGKRERTYVCASYSTIILRTTSADARLVLRENILPFPFCDVTSEPAVLEDVICKGGCELDASWQPPSIAKALAAATQFDPSIENPMRIVGCFDPKILILRDIEGTPTQPSLNILPWCGKIQRLLIGMRAA
jgi:hypothetical protein